MSDWCVLSKLPAEARRDVRAAAFRGGRNDLGAMDLGELVVSQKLAKQSAYTVLKRTESVFKGPNEPEKGGERVTQKNGRRSSVRRRLSWYPHGTEPPGGKEPQNANDIPVAYLDAEDGLIGLCAQV